MNIEEQAQQMVDATSLIVGNRTINIMDKNAVIIASSDKCRIGSHHKGALEVIKSGSEVMIFQDDLERYEGAKVGCNMPILYNRKLVGVVGITGNPNEVRDVARLLCVYVCQWYEQKSRQKQQQTIIEIRQRFVRMLIHKNSFSTELVYELAHILDISLDLNCCLAIISCKNHNLRESTYELSVFIEKTEEYCILNKIQFVSSIENDKLVVIFFNQKQSAVKSVYKYCNKISKTAFSFSVSDIIEKISDICTVYKQVCAIDKFSCVGWHSLDITSDAINYFLNIICRDAGDSILIKYNKLLVDNLSEKEVDCFLNTVYMYYDKNCAVGKCAELLNVHKNTVLYRVRRVHEVLKIAEEQSFSKELLVRLLCIYRNQLILNIDGEVK